MLFKIQEPISDTKIREITSEAIRYFGKYDLSALAKEIKEIKTVDNVYKIARDKYPLAWNRLYKLANLETERLEIEEKYKVDLKENFGEIVCLICVQLCVMDLPLNLMKI